LPQLSFRRTPGWRSDNHEGAKERSRKLKIKNEKLKMEAAGGSVPVFTFLILHFSFVVSEDTSARAAVR
jgi:hypothetical protein